MASINRSTMGLGLVQQVNKELVIKEGELCKRGDTLKMYIKLYSFYLERQYLDSGPLLKYGRVGRPLTCCIDLGSCQTDILKD